MSPLAVWLDLSGRQFHVDVGSPAHERLLKDGAEPIDDPTAEASDAKAKKPREGRQAQATSSAADTAGDAESSEPASETQSA